MNEPLEVRKIPKKSIFLIVLIILISVVGFLFITVTKNMKIKDILVTLGYKNIEDVKVINKLNVENQESKLKSTVYKVVFIDKNLNKKCVGFVHKNKYGKYKKDIDCK
ncbi:MAG: hypothetical protein GY932_03900 [Arcobacter sp.]|nr:hypothetical protein [Arcobacter sp.]